MKTTKRSSVLEAAAMVKANTALLTLIAFMAICTSANAQQEAMDMHLEDTGFVMRAVSPQQFERLRALPPLRFVARTVGSRRYYLYADPDLCKCVFLGNENAMQNYRNLVGQATSAPIGGPGTLPLRQQLDDRGNGSEPEQLDRAW